jgi:hypothetical protein
MISCLYIQNRGGSFGTLKLQPGGLCAFFIAFCLFEGELGGMKNKYYTYGQQQNIREKEAF